MQKSDSIKELAAALSKAQAAMNAAAKSAENPFFKSSYADLASIWLACKDALTKNGLAVSQITEPTPGKVVIETILMHTSGEWLSGKIEMTPKGQDPQSVGSCITYARRYALAAIVGVVTEDDDGHAGSHAQAKPAQQRKPDPAAQPHPDDTLSPEEAAAIFGGEQVPDEPAEKPRPKTGGPVISEAQAKRFFAIAKGTGVSNDTIKEWLHREYGLKSSKDIPKGSYEEICKRVQELAAAA